MKSPCYVGTGTYATQATDLGMPTNGLPLRASRSYDSTHAIDGPMGYGWLSGLVSKLYYATYQYASPASFQNEATITMPSGERYRFAQNPDGTFSGAPPRRDRLVKNGDGTYDFTFQRSRTVLHFAATGELLSWTDDYGNALTYQYDAGTGRLQRVADSSGTGRYLDVFWGADGRINVIRDHSGRQVDYAYTPQGALWTVTDAEDRVTTYAYFAGRFSPLLSQVKDNWDRVITDVTWDGADRVASYTENDELYTYSYSYQGNASVTAKTDSLGNMFIYPVAAYGLVSDTTPPLGGGAPTHYDFYPDGAIQQFIDGVGIRTYYTYNTDGAVLTVTRDYQGAQAIRFDYEYDATFPEKVAAVIPKDPATGQPNYDWQGWRYDYYPPGSTEPGALHHVYRVRDGGGLDTLAIYEYNSRGQVTRVTKPNGGITDYGYSPQGDLTTVTQPSNNDAGTRPVVAYGYDSVGRVTSVTDPLGKATTYTYDDLDRVLTVTLPKPTPASPLTFTTSFAYDVYDSPTGLLFTETTDPNGRVSRQGHDQFGQLVRVIDTLGSATDYGYERGLLTTVTDANDNVTTYQYDSGRRLRKTIFPDGADEEYTYYGDNQLWTKVDRQGRTIQFQYDRLKRLIRHAYPSYQDREYIYDGQKLTQVIDRTVNPYEYHTMTYDPSYRMWSVTQATRGTLTYLYNPDDSVSNVAIQSGPSTSYGYYPDGSLDTIVWSPVAGSFKYRYSLRGQYDYITFPSGARRTYAYDDQGRLTSLANLEPGGTTRGTYAYGYDLNHTTGQNTMLGQRVSMTATVPTQGLSNSLFKYEYDAGYQLTKATYPNVSPFNGEVDQWSYDGIGNRLTSTVNSTTQTYAYQKLGANPLNWQRLTSDGVSSYTYDPSGNTLTRGATTFTWNADDRLTGITGTSSYSYDIQGRRGSKTVGAATSTYLYDGLNLVKEAGAASADYLYGPGIDEPLAMVRGGATYYYGVDGLGSVTLVMNAVGVVQNKYLYDAWGQTRSQTTPVGNPFGYTGREIGEASTLFYRARYYQPSIGRFLSEDPLRELLRRKTGTLTGHFDVYAFPWNNPLYFRDPLGLFGCKTADPGATCGSWCASIYQNQLCALEDLRNLAGVVDSFDPVIGVAHGGSAAMETCLWLAKKPFESETDLAFRQAYWSAAAAYNSCLQACQRCHEPGEPPCPSPVPGGKR